MDQKLETQKEAMDGSSAPPRQSPANTINDTISKATFTPLQEGKTMISELAEKGVCLIMEITVPGGN
jgi:hypothetical protein